MKKYTYIQVPFCNDNNKAILAVCKPNVLHIGFMNDPKLKVNPSTNTFPRKAAATTIHP